MRRISFNWTRGGMCGGVRMARFNIERVAAHHEIAWDTRLLAAEITAKLIKLGEMLSAQEGPTES